MPTRHPLPEPSRRGFLGALSASSIAVAALPETASLASGPRLLRIRTLTAGVPLASLDDISPVQAAFDALDRTRDRCVAAGYEVQTIRIALPPLIAAMSPRAREAARPPIVALDALVAARGGVVSLGPVSMEDRADPQLATWAVRVAAETRVTSFSVMVATPDHRLLSRSCRTAAEIVRALAAAAPGGMANFRFAAAAGVPAGTPFFPVAWHDGPASLAVGCETPRLLLSALADMAAGDTPDARMRAVLDRELTPVAALTRAAAAAEGWHYRGIDPSPAPGPDSSIGAVVESVRLGLFGGAGTLAACSTVTAVLKSLSVQTCGYAGLMLPVLEDPVLARRATEGRYSVRDLLLFSSVCGTGLDVVPLAGNVGEDVLARTIGDVAAMATRLRKPLSARLLPIPAAKAGDPVRLDDPMLVPCVAMPLD
jgi:uncharacterized protein (UPF0210 family)